jgi:manganese efflux pump family protein
MNLTMAAGPSPLQLGLVAVTISLDTFAAAVALGTRLDRSHWFRLSVIFAVVGGVAPLLGVILGVLASGVVAQVASGLGVLVLAALGGWFLHSARTGGGGGGSYGDESRPGGGVGRPNGGAQSAGPLPDLRGREGESSDLALGSILLLALGLSSDNVLVGLGLGLQGGVPALLGGITALSVLLATLGGLALGSLGFAWFGRGAVVLAGLLLIGLAIAFLVGSG